MADLSSVTTLQELVDFLTEFIETVPTQDYVDQQLDKKVSLEKLGKLIPTLVSRIDFEQRLNAKANKADLVAAVAYKADRNEVSTGIVRKADKAALSRLENKVNKIFPFKTVENIAERNALAGDDLDKVVLVVDASDDPRLSQDANGAFYMYSKSRMRWMMESEIKYNESVISYNNILGKPKSSVIEIDTVVAAVYEKLDYVRKLHEIYTKTHMHNSTVVEIDDAVAAKHSHQDVAEVLNVADSDLIPIIRDGVLVNVKARTLKTYLNQ